MDAPRGSRPPEIVFFDVGDTLVRAEPSWADVYLSVCAAHGLELDRSRLEAALVEATKGWDQLGPFEASEEASYRRIKAFDGAVLASLGHPDLPDSFFRAIEGAFASLSAWHIFPDVFPVLDALEAAGVRRAVISNWLWDAPELLHGLRLASRFEALVISARVGYQKPHPAIFRHALEVTGTGAERALHVGDSYRGDVLGARSVGIAPVLIARSHSDGARPRNGPPAEDPVPVIADLYGLLELLDLPVRERAGTAEATST